MISQILGITFLYSFIVILMAIEVISFVMEIEFNNRFKKLLFWLAWIFLAILLFVEAVNRRLGGFGDIGFYKFIALFVIFLVCLLGALVALLSIIIIVYILIWILKKLFNLIGFKHRYK